MPAVSSHAPGTPSWVDLASPDPEGSVRFYGELFGWGATEPGPVEETGGYRMFQHEGRAVAGLGPIQQEGQPPAWLTYVTVEDADATAERIRERGGTPLAGPMDVLTAGRMAVFMDPAGAAFAVWQPRESIGAEVINEAGTLCWNELTTRDDAGAKAFYSAVFGWGPETQPMGDTEYTTWNLGDRQVAGMIKMDDSWPPEIPSHWMTYFAVNDADATAEKATAAGGSVSVPPTDIPIGRFAVLNDPHGAVFSVIRLDQTT